MVKLVGTNAAELQHRLAADHAPWPLWMAKADGGWVYANQAWTRLTGQPPAQALGLGWMACVPDRERARVDAVFNQGIAARAPFDVVHDVLTAEGTIAPMRLRCQPCFESNQQLHGFAGSFAELDAGRVRQGRMAPGVFDSAAPAPADGVLMRRLLDHAPDVIARLDRKFRHVYINRAAGELLGIDASEFIGRTGRELGIPVYIARAYEKAVAAVFTSGQERAFDFRVGEGAGMRHFNARAVPEREPDGRIETVLVVTYDVTSWVRMQVELDTLLLREQTARSQAESAARSRDQFLSVVSHELRSPLNGIQSWTHVLESRVDPGDPTLARALAGIKTGIQQQVRLIDELLDTTRAMNGRLHIPRERVAIADVVARVVARVRKAAGERSLAMRVSYPDEPVQVWGNADRIGQILDQLLDNAIRFNAPGGNVDVHVEPKGGEVCIAVGDTGKGIAADFMPYLFNPFRQADASSSRRTDGLGLGLTLVKYLTELQGGRVAAQSEGEDRGAVFYVYLQLADGGEPHPVASPHAGSAETSDVPSLAGVRVLLVEDHAEARDALTESLRNAGAGVVACGSGWDAVEYLKEVDERNMPNVLLSDLAMPGLDGCDTLVRIREVERSMPGKFRAPIPAIALTASGQGEDRVRALANGFQVYLAKPIEFPQLVSLIQSLARSSAPDEKNGR